LLAFESVSSTFNAKRGSAAFSANCESRSDGDEDGDFTSRTAREDVVPAVTRVAPKTLYDRFKKLVKDFRKEDRVSRTRTGVEEVYSEKQILPGDICSHMDDEGDRIAEEKSEKSRAELALTAAGADMRSKAMRRRKAELEAVDSGEEPLEETPSKKVRRRMHRVDTSDDLGESVTKLITMRMQKESSLKDLEERRIDLEERKFELEVKSREEEREENKARREEERAEKRALIDLLGCMTKHLSKPETE
jgi:hypothetical protein